MLLLVLVEQVGGRASLLLPGHAVAHVELFTHGGLLELTQLVWIHLLELRLVVALSDELLLLVVLEVLEVGGVQIHLL